MELNQYPYIVCSVFKAGKRDCRRNQIARKIQQGKVLMVVNQNVGVDEIQIAKAELGSDITYIGIPEEAQTYFDGQKSVKKVANIIQKRVTTYVNEQR